MIKTTTSWAILCLAGLLGTGCTVTTSDNVDGGTGSDGGGGGSTTGSGTTGTSAGTTGTTSSGTTGTTSDAGSLPVVCCPTESATCGAQITACNGAPSCAAALGDFYDCLKTNSDSAGCELSFVMAGNMEDGGGVDEANNLLTCLDTDHNCPAECFAADGGAGD